MRKFQIQEDRFVYLPVGDAYRDVLIMHDNVIEMDEDTIKQNLKANGGRWPKDILPADGGAIPGTKPAKPAKPVAEAPGSKEAPKGGDIWDE